MGIFDIPLVSLPPTRRKAPRQLSRPIFSRPADWRPCDHFPELSGVVAVDTETDDPGLAAGRGSAWPFLGQGFICGFSVAAENHAAYYPLRHADGNVADPVRALDWLGEQVQKPDVQVVCAKADYDVGWLLVRENILPLNPPVDVQVMGAMLDEFALSYSLDNLALRYLDERKGDKELVEACAKAGLFEPMSHMPLIPGWVAEPYAVQDARLTRALYFRLLTDIKEQKMERVLALESRCTMVAVDMKRRGVRVDVEKAEQEAKRFESLRDEQLRLIHQITGLHTSATDLRGIAQALRAENSELDLPKTARGDDAIQKGILETLNSPVSIAANAARRYDKAAGTFLRGYVLQYAVSGRVHADFNSMRGEDPDGRSGMKGTSTGRWSCSDPNLQNVPRRDPDVGDMVRTCFLPEEGERWGRLDYSSQEPRIAVHVAERAKLQGAQEMGDRFRREPNTDLHAETATLMGVPRSPAKVIFLALLYGASGAKICQQLGLPTAMKNINGSEVEVAGLEASRLLQKHFNAVPWVRGLQKATKEKADKVGWVQTIYGRRLRFRPYEGEYLRTFKAANSVIQGSAADMGKLAVAGLRDAGVVPLVIVHDDVSVSLPQGAEGDRKVALVKDIMENAIKLTIPILADIKIGNTWADA